MTNIIQSLFIYLLGLHSLYLTVKISTMPLNKHQVKTWLLLGSNRLFLRVVDDSKNGGLGTKRTVKFKNGGYTSKFLVKNKTQHIT